MAWGSQKLYQMIGEHAFPNEAGEVCSQMGGCQKSGPFLGPYYITAPNILGYPKRDHNFDNHPNYPATGQEHASAPHEAGGRG